jgi:peptide/nickel transport system substrate-binding protein
MRVDTRESLFVEPDLARVDVNPEIRHVLHSDLTANRDELPGLSEGRRTVRFFAILRPSAEGGSMTDDVRDPLAGDLDPPPQDQVDAELRTFLIADVRGYTSFTNRLGDEMAAKLAAKFARVAREVVEQHQGTVLELRGDEALCVFVSPRQAVRSAVALQRRFVDETRWENELPLPVGIGVDVGEAVPVEGGYRSGALNLAARLCSTAKPGEILATAEVTHLARRLDGMTYVAKEPVQLKGLTEPVRPVRVVPDGEDPMVQLVALGALPPKQPPPGRSWLPQPMRSHRRLSALAVVVVVALVAAGVVVGTQSGGSGSFLSSLRENVVGAIDVGSGRLAEDVAVGSAPADVVAAYGAVWTANVDAGTVSRVDEKTHQVTSIPVGNAPSGITAGGAAVWVANSGSASVSRLDPRAGRVTQTIPVGYGPSAVTFADNALWVVDTTGDAVFRVDPDKGTAALVARVGGSPSSLGVHDGTLWVSSPVTGTVVELDAHTGKVLETVPVGTDPRGLAVIGDSVWVVNNLNGTVSRIATSDATVTATLPVGAGPVAVAGTSGAVWVAAAHAGVVTKIDPRTNRVVGSVRTTSEPAALAADGDRVWVAAGAIPALHRGGTMTVSLWSKPFIDPARAYDYSSEQLLASTFDGLLALRRAPGAAGATVVPDLAAELPSISQDGRTYTFRLRPGIQWSDGKPVTGADVRRGFERTLAEGQWPLYDGIVGADKCSRSQCDLSRGIKSDSTTRLLTIRLTQPDQEFVNKIALLGAVAVPADTPLGPLNGHPIPATGPYVVSQPVKGRYELVRNPHFHEWSAAAQPAGFPDRIIATVSSAASEGSHWQPPDVDWVVTSGVPNEAALRQKYGDRVQKSTSLNVNYVFLDASHPPFDDVRARRAVAYALNRASIGDEWPSPGAVSCQILPPGIPGYEPYCPFTLHSDVPGQWRAPDLTAAQRLVRQSHTAGQLVRIIAPAPIQAMGQVADTMRALGYRVQLQYLPFDKYFLVLTRSPSHFEAGFEGWGADYPAASNFLQTQLACDQASPTGSNFSLFCDKKLDRMMNRAAQLQVTNPAEAAARWSAIERRAVDSAALIGLVVPTAVDIVSTRLGHFEKHVVLGPLFDQAWVR